MSKELEARVAALETELATVKSTRSATLTAEHSMSLAQIAALLAEVSTASTALANLIKQLSGGATPAPAPAPKPPVKPAVANPAASIAGLSKVPPGAEL